jgi:L-alanine-DL-glutamate epimerase-like enolase superfamily enzyme
MDVDIASVKLRFARPVASAFGRLTERELLLVRLAGDDGIIGWGEAAPLEPYDGMPTSAVREALRRYVPLLTDAEDAPGAELLERCREAADVPQALAAIDMALWDRAGQREGVPVCELLVDDPDPIVRVNATIAAEDRAGAAAAAERARREGFSCVKLTVGMGADAGRVAAVRAAAGPDMDLRLDANGAWGVEEAVRSIEALAPAGLELVEEPVHGVEALRQVRERVPVRIAMDETAGDPGSLHAAVADAVCLKISRCGGISGLLAQAALVRSTGAEVYLSSTYDGPLGIAAAVHCAAALRPEPANGLGTLELFSDDFSVLRLEQGRIPVPQEPGLGV